MAEGVTRRALLGSIGMAATAATGQAARASGRVQTDQDWPTFGYDEANSNYAPATTGPTADVGRRWQVETDGAVSSSAAVVDDTVYVGDDRGNFYALAVSDGSVRWQFQAGGQIASSPAVVDETVYFGSRNNTVYAVDRSDGTERWRFETEDQVTSSPTVVDGTVYVGSHDFRLYALDARDGSQEWEAFAGNAISGTPAVVDGTVYVGSEDRSLYALGASEGELLWEFEAGGELVSAPAVDPERGTVYVTTLTGVVYAVDAASGQRQWEYQTGGPVAGSPAVTDDTVCVGSRDGTLYALDASGGAERWTFDTPLRISSTPSVAGDVVYFGDQIGTVSAVGVQDGTERFQFETGESFTTAPAVVDGVAYIGSASGVMYALEDGAEFATATPAEEGTDDDGGDTSLVTLLALPAAAITMVGLLVGTLYAASRAGLFEPLEEAAPDPPPFEAARTPSGETDEDSDESPIWEVVMEDVIRRADESDRTATQDVLVTKYVDEDSLSAPMVAYEVESLRSEPATVVVSEPVDPDDADRDAIGKLPGGEGWEIQGDRLVFETRIGPEQTTRTLIARRDLSADSAELFASPAIEVE